MTSGVIIQGTGLSRRYRMGSQSITALGDVDLSVREGEIVALMGPSGSG